MKLIPVTLALSVGAAPLAAQEATFRLIDHLVVTEASHPDLPLREISALAWDAASETLLALSDRNDLYELTLGADPDRIDLTLTAQTRLTDEGGERLKGKHFGVEGVSFSDSSDDMIAILSEAPPELSLFDRQGQRVERLALPPELQDMSRLRSKSNGLESLALHPELGYLFAPEAPLEGQPRRTHAIYGSDGPVLAFQTGEAGSTNIKAMETLPDGRLLILERDRLDKATIQPFLRVIDPAACPIATPCSPPAAELDLPPPLDADFEGIAWLGNDRLLIASDDRVDDQARTVFAMMELLPAQ